MEFLKGKKTVIFFGLALLVAVANFFGFGDFQMSEEQLEVFNVVLPLIGLVLRYLTDSAIFSDNAKG